MRLQQLLQSHNRDVHSVPQECTVEEAVRTLAERSAGALIVTDEGRPAGIFTRTDVYRCHASRPGRSPSEIHLKEAMTNKLVTAGEDHLVEECLSMMLRMEIDHLPVVEDGRFLGILTLRELFRYQLEFLAEELQHLQDYLNDLQDAAHD